MSLIVEHLVKEYGPQKAVNDISFEVKEGEIVGFLGPNGAGKSTTLKIATTYLPPTSGRVIVGGFDVAAQPMAVMRAISGSPSTTVAAVISSSAIAAAYVNGFSADPDDELDRPLAIIDAGTMIETSMHYRRITPSETARAWNAQITGTIGQADDRYYRLAVDWSGHVARFNVSRDAVKASPEYDPSTTLQRDHEARLHAHYGVAPYWS